MSDPIETPFECIDPSVGGSIWRLEQSDVNPQLRVELLAHVSVCDSCRLLVRLEEKARELAESGSLEHTGPKERAASMALPTQEPQVSPVLAEHSEPAARSLASPSRQKLRMRRIHVTTAAGIALAACLAAIVFTPPQPVTGRLSARGNEGTRFLRPVEGEVVSTAQPILRWTPLEGASRYFIEIRDEKGASLWQGESADETIRLPDEVSLESGHNYKALLSVQPADLLAPGETSVRFRSDSRWRETLHRLRWTHPFLQWTSVLAFGVLLLTGIRRPRIHARRNVH
jgi:hypothetical protein